MECMYSDFDGVCQLFDKDFPIEGYGCDNEGNCICEHDPEPSLMCGNYEPIE